MNVKSLRISESLYFTGLLMLVAGLPVSLFLTSLSQFFIVASFIADGNVLEKFKRFLSNKPALFLSGIWLMHLIGMLWTSDVGEGLKDLRIKLPLLLLPMVIAGNDPLTYKKLRWVLLTFVGAVFCGTMVSMAVLAGIIHRNIYDIRDVFIFNISHIRFALFTCLAIFILIYYAFFDKSNIPSRNLRIAAGAMIVWLLVFLVIVVSVTGLLIFSATSIALILIRAILTTGKKKRIVLLASLVAIPFISIFTLKSLIGSNNKARYTIPAGSDKTKLGNDYDPPSSDTVYENGYPVWVFVCEKELRDSWNQVSVIKYDSLDERNQPLRSTLIRYMSSKGLRKDAEGLNALSADDRRSVERGIANINYRNISSMRSRMQQIAWEVDQFLRFGNVSGHSVTQRFIFWQAGMRIASSNFFTGVGTGDMPQSYKMEYDKMKSPLDPEHRLRAHNQFLAIMVAFGIFGLCYFVFALFYPVISQNIRLNMMFMAFFLISFLSMFSEDTLETQAGVTFFAFFFVFLMQIGTIEVYHSHIKIRK